MTYGTDVKIATLRCTAMYLTSEKVEEGYYRRYLNDIKLLIPFFFVILKKFI